MIKSGQLLRFDNNVNNRYKSTLRKSNTRRNSTQVRKQIKPSTQDNGRMIPEVVITAKRPVKNKPKDTGKRNTGNPNNNPTIVFKPENKSDFVNYLYNDEIRKRKMSLAYDQRKRQFDNYSNRITK